MLLPVRSVDPVNDPPQKAPSAGPGYGIPVPSGWSDPEGHAQFLPATRAAGACLSGVLKAVLSSYPTEYPFPVVKSLATQTRPSTSPVSTIKSWNETTLQSLNEKVVFPGRVRSNPAQSVSNPGQSLVVGGG